MLPAEGFYERKVGSKDGRTGTCKACILARSHAWRKANKERAAARARAYDKANLQRRRAWREANKERLAAKWRAWYETHKESERAKARLRGQVNKKRKNETHRAWGRAHPDRRLAYGRSWTKRHPAEKRAAKARRRAAELRQLAEWADHEAIKAIYAEAIRLTRETGIKHHVDHVIPLQGKLVWGLHVETNLQILTAKDNHKKGNRLDL